MSDDWGSLWRRDSCLKGHRGPTDTRLAAFSCLSSLLPLLSSASPLGEADPLLFYWANLQPNSSSQVFWLRAGSLLCVRRSCRRTSNYNCRVCFCVGLSTFWGSIMLFFLFSISIWDCDPLQKTLKKKIKQAVSHGWSWRIWTQLRVLSVETHCHPHICLHMKFEYY